MWPGVWQFWVVLRDCCESARSLIQTVLLRGDFVFYDWGLILTVRRTKAIQFRECKLEIPIARCGDRGPVCGLLGGNAFSATPGGSNGCSVQGSSSGGRGGSSPMSYEIYPPFHLQGRTGGGFLVLPLAKEGRLHLSGHVWRVSGGA